MKQLFDIPIEAHILRIYPQNWHHEISLKVELIGCAELETTLAYETTTNVGFQMIILIHLFLTLITQVKSEQCDDPMGVENGQISFQQISVSSEFSPKNSKESLKINGDNAWQPFSNSPMEWIEVSAIIKILIFFYIIYFALTFV